MSAGIFLVVVGVWVAVQVVSGDALQRLKVIPT